MSLFKNIAVAAIAALTIAGASVVTTKEADARPGGFTDRDSTAEPIVDSSIVDFTTEASMVPVSVASASDPGSAIATCGPFGFACSDIGDC
jgi:hypothetical protein